MWFKYLVFALFIFEAMLELAKMGGWEEKRKSSSIYFYQLLEVRSLLR